jgi:pseudouridine kinase
MDGAGFSPNPEGHVLIIGTAGIDIVGRLRSDLKPGTSNPARIRTSFGGVARNVAENLARLGQPVILISAVGKDSSGDRLLAHTREAGVDVSEVMYCTECPTGSYLATVNSSGELKYALDDMRAIALITPDYLKERAELFHKASILFVDANLSKETLRTAISLGMRARIPVCADPTSTVLAEKLRVYLPRLQLITPNTAEASALSGFMGETSRRKQALRAAKYLVGQGVEIVLVSLAEQGVVYATSTTSGHIPAIRTEYVDSTGAGDALTATVIFGLLNDFPLDDAVRLGVSAASLTIRWPGAVRPDLTLEKLYDELVV